jgi:porphobilinogen synthase
MKLTRRPRRLRTTQAMRDLVADVDVPRRALMQPLFTIEKPAQAGPIDSLQGIARETIDDTLRTVERDLEKGVRSFLLFGVPARKDLDGTAALDPEGITPRAISAIKKRFGDAAVLALDVCLCPHLEHGHCGVLKGEDVENDPSAAILAKVAVLYAQAGADIVAPSDMMDGRIGAMREALDAAGKQNTTILSYAVKYASNYYGPFREAANSAPAFGDRRAYQMDYRRTLDALEEVHTDIAEGADLVMVKPALAYLDVIARVRDAVDVPVVAYNVSGEFAAVKALAKAGLADETKLAMENLIAMRRAGADVIITYHARELAKAGVLS